MRNFPRLSTLIHKIREDDIFNGAAVLGFYLTLAMFPAVILTMALIPYLPIEHVDQAIMDLLGQALPANAADMFKGVVQEVTQKPRRGLLSFGLVASLWATSTGMYAVMQQLNTIYGVKEARGFVRGRLVAIGLSMLFVVLVILSFSLVVLGGVMQDWLGAYIGKGTALLTAFVWFRWVVIVSALVLGFALIYFLAPNFKQPFALVTPGSVAGALLLVLASLGFARYVQSFGDYSAMYGSVGAMIVLMLWLYMTGLAILIGAELNALVRKVETRAALVDQAET